MTQEEIKLTEEEIEYIERRRKSQNPAFQPPPGIGTGSLWAKASLKRKKFIDEGIWIEKEGR